MTASYIGKHEGSKLFRLSLEWSGGIVQSVSIRGDFFAHPEEGFEAAEQSLVGCKAHRLGKHFAKAIEQAGVALYGLSAADIDAAIADIAARFPHTGLDNG